MAGGLRAGAGLVLRASAALYEGSQGVDDLLAGPEPQVDHSYDPVEPTPSVESMLAEIDADPTCIFLGLRTRA